MDMEYGKCVKCGEEIGPYIGDGSDSLCKHCHDKDGSRLQRRADSYLPATRRRSAGGGWEPVFTLVDLHESRQWQDEIDERLDAESHHKDAKDAEDDDNSRPDEPPFGQGAGVGAVLPKTPFTGSEHKN
jgi:hypothetical protein